MNIEKNKELDLENFFQDNFNRLKFIYCMNKSNGVYYYDFDYKLDIKHMKNLPRDIKRLYLTKNKIQFIPKGTSEHNNIIERTNKQQRKGFFIEEEEFNEKSDFGLKTTTTISRNGDLRTTSNSLKIYIEVPPFNKYKILTNLPNKLDFLLVNVMNNEKINYISSKIKHLSFKDKCWNTLCNLPNSLKRIDFIEKKYKFTIIKKPSHKLDYIVCCCDNNNKDFSDCGIKIKDKHNNRIIIKYIENKLKDKMYELYC